MRLVMDAMIALMLALVLAGVLLHQRARTDRLTRVETTQRAVRTIQSQALYHGSLRAVDVTHRGYPLAIELAWFDRPPTNPLAAGANDWLDTAGPEQANRYDPAQLTCDGQRAAFWYNPYRGVVRARITRQPSEQATVELYNLVNGTSLRTDDVQWQFTEPLSAAPTDTEP